MKARTPTQDLQRRCINRGMTTPRALGTLDHVRAELDRLERQVRKLYPKSGATRCLEEACSNQARHQALNDILALITEAKR